MLDKNKRVHRPERLKGHDYSRPGCYFITLTTRVRGKDIFCSIEGKREAEAPVGPAPLGRPIPRKQPDFPKFPLIRLTPVGAVVQELIEKIPAVYRDVHIDCYVIMPDHVHLLLWLGEPLADGIDIPGNDGRRSFLEGGDGPARGPGPTALPKIINAVKSLTTRRLGEPIWQDHYYDHIIRNQRELENTRQYIRDNPMKWFLNRESDHSVF